MKWLELANLLFDKSNALSPTGAHLHLDTPGWFRTWTPHQNHAADCAARFFAKHLDWPPLEPDGGCQLYFRCLFALEICIKNDAQGPPPPDTPESQQRALEELLIAAWERDDHAAPGPRFRLESLRVFHATCFPHHGDPDLPRVMKFILDSSHETSSQCVRLGIVDLFRMDDDPQFAPRLDGEALVDAREREADLLQVLEPFDVGRHRFRTRPWT
jgi:hypothetical protein